VFAVFALLYRHALTKREELSLSELEVFETRHAIKLYTLIAALGVLIAFSGSASMLEKRGGPWRFISYAFVVADFVGIAALFRLRMSARTHRHTMETLTPFPSEKSEALANS
jgi:hypothetical protein